MDLRRGPRPLRLSVTGPAVALALAACTANPPPPDPAALPATPPPVAPETPPETPPVAPETPPEPAPTPLLPPTALTLYPAMIASGFANVDALPSGHLLYHDDRRFVVLKLGDAKPTAKPAKPAPAPKDSPDAAPVPQDSPAPVAEPAPKASLVLAIHPLPPKIVEAATAELADLFAELADEKKKEEAKARDGALAEPDDDDADEDFEEEETDLHGLHGAWPDHLHATLETSGMRTGATLEDMVWKDGAWAPGETIADTEGEFVLSRTVERYLPWTKGRWLAQTELTCLSGCFEDGMEEEPVDAATRKRERRLDKRIERHKPLTVVGGPTTPLPDMTSEFTPDILSLPTGDLWVTRTTGTADRWNLTTKAWQPHPLPEATLGRNTRLAGTSTGAAWFSRCEPTPRLAFLDGGNATAVELPEPACVTRMAVDASDGLWVLLTSDGMGIRGPLPSLWHRADPTTPWQRVELAPIALPGGGKQWVSDGDVWEEIEVPAGSFTVRPYELFTAGPGDLWVYGPLEDQALFVLARTVPGPPPFDLRTADPLIDDVGLCIRQHAELGTLPAGADPATAWPAALAELGKLPVDPTDPLLYEVEADGKRTFYAEISEARSAERIALEVRLKPHLPGMGHFECGLPPRPTREHELPTPDEPDEPDAE